MLHAGAGIPGLAYSRSMKDFLVDLARGVAGALFSVVACVLVVVIGALLVGYGIAQDWRWMVNGGVFLAVLGVLFLYRFWIDD